MGLCATDRISEMSEVRSSDEVCCAICPENFAGLLSTLFQYYDFYPSVFISSSSDSHFKSGFVLGYRLFTFEGFSSSRLIYAGAMEQDRQTSIH